MTTVEGQRSQGHVTYQQQQRRNSATGDHISFELGGNYHRWWANHVVRFLTSKAVGKINRK